ncbi:DUF6318 family protein [Dermabacter sp. HSID17554]|uniref:DUF6318 family protein n=1 Tax=Dermabacter sp. HSID17554 TaxID=2419511 RepID=UPI000F8762EA|nr:DUF6318 family protein [Dermabacter sp. HSID17554]RUP85704.1 hypothetical protein D8M36_08595 [Dermabacter sp. HSID17554]
MSKTTQRIVVLIFALALVIPAGLVGLGQFSQNNQGEQQVADSAQDTRKKVDPASQPTPTNTTAPSRADVPSIDEESEAGAKATAQYLFAVYAYMIGTGDTSAWRELMDPSCEECMRFADNAEQLHAAGGWIVGGDITLSDEKVTLAKGDGASDGASTTAKVDATFHEAPAQLIDDPTREPATRGASQGKFSVGLRFVDGHWRVASMAVG